MNRFGGDGKGRGLDAQGRCRMHMVGVDAHGRDGMHRVGVDG